MRFRKEDKANLLKVGLFITGLTIVLMILVVSIGKDSSLFESKVEIKAIVTNVSNLKPGSYVELKGIRIGTVTSISIISEEAVQIVMKILTSELKWIKQDSKVSISTAGLVGDKFVEIYNGSRDAHTFNPNSDSLSSEDGPDFKKILTKGESIATSTDQILIKLDHLLTRLDDGDKIVQTINSLQKTSLHLEKFTSRFDQELLSNMNMSMTNFNKVSTSMAGILNRVEKGPGTLNSLIYEDGVHDDLRVLLGGAQRNKVIKYFIRESIKKSESRKGQED